MKDLANTNTPASPDAGNEWESRKRNNVRLAWGFAGFALVMFLAAIWKLRPF